MVSIQLLLFSCLCQNSTHFFCISHYHLQCLQSAIRHNQPTTLLCVNSLPDVVRSSQIAAFADDTKVFKEITSTRDAEKLQEDLEESDHSTTSDSLNFNYSKCKAQRILGNLNPSSLSIIWPALSLKLTLPRRILHH